jgi:two-component system, NarL family, nitrate/nitrite response regulator NarL
MPLQSRQSPTPSLPDPRLLAVGKTVLDALVVVDDERRCLYVNPAALRLLGASSEVLLARRLEDFTPPENLEQLHERGAEFARAGELEGAYELVRADGARRRVAYRATWAFGEGQHLIAAREVVGRPDPDDGRPRLTRREREVLQIASRGGSVRVIAGALVLSSGTVKTHLQNIYGKLGVPDRASAVAEGLRRGLIE